MNNKIVVINGKNTYIINGNITRILLTQNKATIIDTEDIPLVWPYKWHTRLNRRVWYACSSVGHRGPKLLMHRILLNPSKHLYVDHQDHDGLNNRKYNIRICTIKQNNCNRPPRDGKNYIGINFTKRGKWRGRISVNGKRVEVGTFKDKDDALRAINTAKRKYHGEFAWLNPVQPKPKPTKGFNTDLL